MRFSPEYDIATVKLADSSLSSFFANEKIVCEKLIVECNNGLDMNSAQTLVTNPTFNEKLNYLHLR